MAKEDVPAIFLSPQDNESFLAAIAVDPDAKAGGEVDLKLSLPPLWNGGYKTHMHKLNGADPASVASRFTPDFIKEMQLSHLAVLESDQNPGAAFYFNADAITHNA